MYIQNHATITVDVKTMKSINYRYWHRMYNVHKLQRDQWANLLESSKTECDNIIGSLSICSVNKRKRLGTQ